MIATLFLKRYWLSIFWLALCLSLSSHAVNPCARVGELSAEVRPGGSRFPVTHWAGQENPIAITGEFYYPTPYVLANLGLASMITPRQKAAMSTDASRLKVIHSTVVDPSRLELSTSWLRGKKVLSLAEGYSGLMPFFLAQGADAIAVDAGYGTPIPPEVRFSYMMNQYQNKFRHHLIAGDATALPASIPRETYDLVVSHKLLNNFRSIGHQEAVVRQAFERLKPGGRAQLTLDPPDEATTDEAIVAYAKQLLKELPADEYDFVLQHGEIDIQANPHVNAEEIPTDSFPWTEYESFLFFPPDGSQGLGVKWFQKPFPFVPLDKEVTTLTLIRKS